MNSYKLLSIEKTTKEVVVLQHGIESIEGALNYMREMKECPLFDNDDLVIYEE